jgi:hypothetical protein
MGTKARPSQLRVPAQVQSFKAALARRAARTGTERRRRRKGGRQGN